MGPSGAGKSALLHAIAGLIEGVKGQVAIDGYVVEWPGSDKSRMCGKHRSAEIFNWGTS